MNVKSKCTIPANHFEYFIMGAKYHYSPPVQSTPTSNRHRSLHPSREPRANPSVTVRYEGEEIETETQQDDERWRKRGRGIYRVRKEDGRGRRGRTRARGRKREVYVETCAVDAIRREYPRDGEARGVRVHVYTRACTQTDGRGRNTRERAERARTRSGERARYGVCDRD